MAGNKGKVLAITAASLFTMGATMSAHAEGAPASAPTVSDSVHCTGINSCKGTSDCKTAENACKGKNACKGHGFVSTSKADCAKKGGKVLAENKAK